MPHRHQRWRALKPLDEIASGGEMSRVLLALKVSVEEGAAARQEESANALPARWSSTRSTSASAGGPPKPSDRTQGAMPAQQVLCVTHLPQIAAFADQHFVVEKTEERGRIRTTVRSLAPAERVEEVARMLSGAKRSETSLRHAEQMLAEAAGGSRESAQ